MAAKDFQAEVFVRRYSSDGKELVYSTLVGPVRFDAPVSLAVDAEGNSYVAYRFDPGILQPLNDLEPSAAVAVVKITNDGSRFSYRAAVLPEGFYAPPIGLAVDRNGSVYAASGSFEVGIRKIDPQGTRIEAKRQVECGPVQGLTANALAIGPDNSVYLAGTSKCDRFLTTPGAYRTATANPLNGDAYVMRFTPDLGTIVYATLLGGDSVDRAFALAVGADGAAFVAGQTLISRGLEPMPAAPLGNLELVENMQYGFAAALSPDGSSLQAAVLLPVTSATAISTDVEGNVYVAGASAHSAFLARISQGLQAFQYVVDAPVRSSLIPSIGLSKGRLLFGGSGDATAFPDNDPGVSNSTSVGFFGFLPEKPSKSDLQLEVETLLTVPEVYGSFTACRFTLSNRGENEVSQILLTSNIEGNASFQLWRADPPVFNVLTLFSLRGGPKLASVSRLGPGESATIEFLSGNLMFLEGIRCSGQVFSATAEDSVSNNSAESTRKPDWITVTINGPNGLRFRRDDWPILSPMGNAGLLRATPNSRMRIFLPSPQTDSLGRTFRFERWSDGVTGNPRVFTLGQSTVVHNAVFVTTPEGSPANQDPGDGMPPPSDINRNPLYMTPSELSVGSENRAIRVNGDGLRNGWQVLWNGEPRETEYISSYQLQVTLRPEDIERPSLAWISVRDPEQDVVVRAPRPLWINWAIPNNDVVYDRTRRRLWVALPDWAPPASAAGQNRIALVDPTTGTIEASVAIEASAQKLALTDDGRYLHIAAPGRMFRLNTEELAIDLDYALSPEGIGPKELQVYSMLAVPDRPGQVLVSTYSLGTLLFDHGALVERQLTGREGPGVLYGWTDANTAVGGDGNVLYFLTVDNGVTMARVLPGVLSSPLCQLETGLLYCNSGAVLNAADGSRVRQYPARGAVGVSPEADRVVYFDQPGQSSLNGAFGPIVSLRQSTAEWVSTTAAPLPGEPGTVIGWHNGEILYRPASSDVFSRTVAKLYLFKVQ